MPTQHTQGWDESPLDTHLRPSTALHWGLIIHFFSFAFCLFVLFLLCSSLEYLSRVSSPILQPERECEADEGREHKLTPQERLHHLSLNQHLQDLPAQAPPPALGSEGSHVLGSSLCRNPEKGLEKFLNPQASPSPRRIISQKLL